MKTQKSVVVLISGSGSNLQAIIDYSLTESSHYEVTGVISNREDAYGLVRAEQHGIPSQLIDHRAFASREMFDQALIKAIDKLKPDLLVLAGFMRILTAEFVQHYAGKLLNIHPSLLPKYQGLNTHQRALDAGDKEHGVSVHFVTEELDGGPVIMQSCIDIHTDDDVNSLQTRIHEREHLIYPLCVDWFAQERVYLQDNIVYIDNAAVNTPLIYENLDNGKYANHEKYTIQPE